MLRQNFGAWVFFLVLPFCIMSYHFYKAYFRGRRRGPQDLTDVADEGFGGSTVGTEARSDMHSLRAKLYIGRGGGGGGAVLLLSLRELVQAGIGPRPFAWVAIAA